MTLSSYGGSDLVGNIIRRLMKGGDAIFPEILDYLTSMSNDNKLRVDNDNISNCQIITTWKYYRSMHYLFNRSFYMLNLKRGTFTEERLEWHIECVPFSLDKWLQKRFIITNKMYLLLAHSVDDIRSRKWVFHLEEHGLEW